MIAILALLSGVPALVYQVVWTREVGLLVGTQIEAIACVLAAFFGGLALGSRWLGPVADRVRRKTGLSFIDAFMTEDEGVERGFAVTVDMRLIPTTKVKPDTGSPFHGVEVGGAVKLPFAFVVKRNSKTWKLLRMDIRPEVPNCFSNSFLRNCSIWNFLYANSLS